MIPKVLEVLSDFVVVSSNLAELVEELVKLEIVDTKVDSGDEGKSLIGEAVVAALLDTDGVVLFSEVDTGGSVVEEDVMMSVE